MLQERKSSKNFFKELLNWRWISLAVVFVLLGGFGGHFGNEVRFDIFFMINLRINVEKQNEHHISHNFSIR